MGPSTLMCTIRSGKPFGRCVRADLCDAVLPFAFAGLPMQVMRGTCTGSEGRDACAIILQSSRNMLDGATGRYAWAAGMWFAQFVLNNRRTFEGLRCLELGCGVGVVGVCLARSGACEVRTGQPKAKQSRNLWCEDGFA